MRYCNLENISEGEIVGLVKNLKSGNLVTVQSLLAGNHQRFGSGLGQSVMLGCVGRLALQPHPEPLPNVGGWGLTVEKALGSGVGSDGF